MKNNIEIIDVSAWIGSYPFRGIPNSSLQDLQANCRKLSINKVIVSSFENLFQKNGFDAYETWQRKIENLHSLEHWPVVNPTIPRQIESLKKIVDCFNPKGLRLLPNYHHYNLKNNCVKELMSFCKENSLIVQLFQRLADERWQWMLQTPAVDQKQLEDFVDEHTDQPIIICGINQPALLSDQLKTHNQLYVDTSRVRGPVFAFEELIKKVPVDKIIFGSLWPIQITQATLWQIQNCQIPSNIKNKILYENFHKSKQ